LSRLVIYLTTLFQQIRFCCGFRCVQYPPSRKPRLMLSPDISRISHGAVVRILLQDYSGTCTVKGKVPESAGDTHTDHPRLTSLHLPTWTRQTRNSIETRQTRLYPTWRVSANTKASDHRLDASNAIPGNIGGIRFNWAKYWTESY
jgi:hypothetical protein